MGVVISDWQWKFEAFLKMPEAIVPTYTNIKSFKKDTMSNKWGYGGDNGPSYWHVVEGCAYSIAVEGTRQSPIDVKPSQVEVDEELGEMKYMYNANNCVSVENTGASWKVDVNSDGSHLSGGPLGKDEYKLIQFHAHWGGKMGVVVNILSMERCFLQNFTWFTTTPSMAPSVRQQTNLTASQSLACLSRLATSIKNLEICVNF